MPPHLRCVATLYCEMLKNRKTSNNLNQVSCLTINQQICNELHEPYSRQLMQSQQILKMSSSSPNADTQVSAPLVDGIVNHVLLQSGPDQQRVQCLPFFDSRCITVRHLKTLKCLIIEQFSLVCINSYLQELLVQIATPTTRNVSKWPFSS